jgi:hypothetical protein
MAPLLPIFHHCTTVNRKRFIERVSIMKPCKGKCTKTSTGEWEIYIFCENCIWNYLGKWFGEQKNQTKETI